MTTTQDSRSIRELAIIAVERQDHENAEAEAEERATRSEHLTQLAGRQAVEILGEVAEGAQWSVLDERNATAWIAGELFRVETGIGIDFEYPHELHHVIPCPTCGQGRTARIYSLESLGGLLRDADSSRYHCDTCAARKRDARRQAEASLPPLPTAADREQALRDAAAYHQIAKDRFADADEDGAAFAAQVSQSASALARAIQQDVQTWGEAS